MLHLVKPIDSEASNSDGPKLRSGSKSNRGKIVRDISLKNIVNDTWDREGEPFTSLKESS